ncbi:MAG: HNH endonuclease [Clostridium sp.]|nr:HNH endonuclease [Clostridium sp.]
MSSGVLKKFYSSDEWINFRQIILLERSKHDGIHCERCDKRIVVSKHIQLHHIIELTEDNYQDKMISLNPDNVEILCQGCHNRHHKRWSGGGHKRKEKAVYIVYGPPMSGKNSYVIEHMERGDLVIDMDSLYQAVTLLPKYDKPDELLYNVFAIRNSIIQNIKTRYGGYRTAWIIGGYPRKVERERLARETRAELILMDVDRDTCIKRLNKCNDYRSEHKEEWINYIDKWFDEFRK